MKRRGYNDPVYFLLENPRMLNRNTIDGLWVRIIDPKKFLEGRIYNSEGNFCIELTGQNQNDIEGVYSFETDGKNTKVQESNSKPDITMRPSDLSSCYFGGITAMELYKSNNIICENQKKLEEFSRIFSVTNTPWCNTDF